jgi:hypothetical protein
MEKKQIKTNNLNMEKQVLNDLEKHYNDFDFSS